MRAEAALRDHVKSFAVISVMAETSPRACPVHTLPGSLGLRLREQAWLAGRARPTAHYPVNRDARAAASRFAEPNSQDSPSLDEKDSGSLKPRQRSTDVVTLPAESIWRQDVRSQCRACAPPRGARGSPAAFRCRVGGHGATPHRPLRGNIRFALQARTDPVSLRFPRYLAVRETPNGKVPDLHRLAPSLDAPT